MLVLRTCMDISGYVESFRVFFLVNEQNCGLKFQHSRTLTLCKGTVCDMLNY